MGLHKCPRSSWASKLDAHPLCSFVELSYTYSSSASVAWQSLLLALIYIVRPLHCLTIHLVDARLSTIFFHYIPLPSLSLAPVLLSPLLTHIYWVKWKRWSLKKYYAIAWFGTRIFLILYFYARKTERVMLIITKCIEVPFFSFIIMEGNDELHACFVLLLQYQIDRLLTWITRSLIFMPWLDYLINIMLGSIPQKTILFYNLPPRGRAGIELGDADMSLSYL